MRNSFFHGRKSHVASLIALGVAIRLTATGAGAATPDYSQVDAIWARHCLDCHSSKDPEGQLMMDSLESLLKGGESGPAVLPGKAGESLVIRAIEGRWEKDGKAKQMPPGKRRKLERAEVAVIREWIDAGAPKPQSAQRRPITTPDIAPRVPAPRSIQAVDFSQPARLVAAGRYGEVELISTESRLPIRKLTGHRGKVNAVHFSSDGTLLASAAGQPGQVGELKLWRVQDGSLIRTIEGHQDALYAVQISPDSKWVASGSYDQEIKVWDAASGLEARTFHGHNGAIYDLAFRPDGKILASASGDRTVKLWDVETGRRLETLSQSTKEIYSVVWNPKGDRLFAGGVDNRIRMWSISPTAAETTNPLLESRFAHEGTILSLAMSPDGRRLVSSAEDRLIKIWDTATLTERLAFPEQPDLAPGISFLSEGNQIIAGRLDGSIETYSVATGKPEPLPKPQLIRLQPRGLQRGTTVQFELAGKGLESISQITFDHPKLTAGRMGSGSGSNVTIRITAEKSLPRGTYSIKGTGPAGESNPLQLIVDDLPPIQENPFTEINRAETLPASFWGTLEAPGDADSLEFKAQAGQELILDLNAKLLGSPLNGRLDLLDSEGVMVASETTFAGGDPLMVYRVERNGAYRAVIRDNKLAGSAEHFYRLSIGEMPYVVGVYPPSVAADGDRTVGLVGYNLPPNASVTVKAGSSGEILVPVDPDRYRSRSPYKVLINTLRTVDEVEANDRPDQATPLPSPGIANGRIHAGKRFETDVDHFSFVSKKWQPWIIETDAARRGSPIDTTIEVLHPDGRPIERVLLQAVRNTAVNFRAVEADATGMRLDHYEEMELNQFLYMNGEVMKLFRMPQGPDSEMMMYTLGGKRRTFFDTSPTAHALDQQGFIVLPHPPGSQLVKNGLPTFHLHYSNDDDAERRGGRDSWLAFTAPEEGTYVVRVADSAGRGGDLFSYRLIVREPDPGFHVFLEGANPQISPGSGQSFTLRAERRDGFSGEIRIDISGVPVGFSVSTPLIIEAGHQTASGTIHAIEKAVKPTQSHWERVQITAQAEVDGRLSVMAVNSLGSVELKETSSALMVRLDPYVGQDSTNTAAMQTSKEIVLEPGQTTSAWLSVERRGFEDTITFEVSNLPHGVIVDNLGLNGITFLKGENGRQIFLKASPWVKDQDRPFFAVANQAGRQASEPLLLKIRSPGHQPQAVRTD
ncbi:MAG: hypothetical protein JNN07_12745 [Verrucomicrobiales bacterium]|nr:hypothetical protein [Verrucomicrobiales bacterium]